ncbi:MAG: hypothetical protein P4N59_17830 [Negativicutes bacterium]|nr:hypothetical protein [Negativicutes bacterium]
MKDVWLFLIFAAGASLASYVGIQGKFLSSFAMMSGFSAMTTPFMTGRRNRLICWLWAVAVLIYDSYYADYLLLQALMVIFVPWTFYAAFYNKYFRGKKAARKGGNVDDGF